MYTKKVIEYFQNPHNYGRIKNPDGIGKVGNPTCLLPKEEILLNGLFEEIEKAKIGDFVVSHNSNKNKIIQKTLRNYQGKAIELKSCLGKILLTSEHLVLGMKMPKHSKFLRTKNKKELIPAWYHAEQLEKRDIILYPIFKEKENLKHIEINIPKSKWDFRSKKIPNRIPLNSDLLRLFGYFLAEGYIQDRSCSTFISFSLNIKEKEIVEDIRNISKKLFDLDVKVKEIPERKTVVVCLYNAQIARFFKKLFGNGAKHKKIPEFIMNLPFQKQKSLLFGLWQGDGYVNLNRNGPRAGYATISYQLSQQIKILLLRQKIVPSIYTEKEKKVKEVNHKKAYRIHVGQSDSLKRLCDILGIKYSSKSYKAITSWLDKDFLYTPITSVNEINYKGIVYNLEVNNTHSFISEAFSLHNCGDVMHLYIKVGQNKKREEIIKDIKFETFGCVAAISTSSIITDLAKGKTLKQALEIDNNEVVKSLGELPAIKIHCSLLAVDALSEAIYDYLSKNKKEIPKDLQKKHERTEKERQKIEKRY